MKWLWYHQSSLLFCVCVHVYVCVTNSIALVYTHAYHHRYGDMLFEQSLAVRDPKNFLSAPRMVGTTYSSSWCHYCVVIQKSQSTTKSNKKKRNLRTFGSSSKPRKGPAPTVSAQFHTSLLSLMERLEQTHPYFVRCIKSNNDKVTPPSRVF